MLKQIRKILSSKKAPAPKEISAARAARNCCRCKSGEGTLFKPEITFFANDPNATPVKMSVGDHYCGKCAKGEDVAGFINEEVWATVQAAMLARNLTVNAKETAHLQWIKV